jgi:hypothetical protein
MFFIAVGAILYFAVSKTVDGLNLDAVGVVLMVVGAGGLLISIAMLANTRTRGGRTTVVQESAPVREGTTTVVQRR